MSNYLSDFDISGYGLSAQRFRMNVISSNIANANTVRTAEGGPYRRREVIFKAVDFDSVLNDEVAKKHNLYADIPYGLSLQTTEIIQNCNGFQILTESHLLPGSMIKNDHRKFICRDQTLRIENNATLWTGSYEPGQEIAQ